MLAAIFDLLIPHAVEIIPLRISQHDVHIAGAIQDEQILERYRIDR
jgi:hypothetical protein